jgi:hypothetical protein
VVSDPRTETAIPRIPSSLKDKSALGDPETGQLFPSWFQNGHLLLQGPLFMRQKVQDGDH